MVADSRFHCGCDPKRAMHTAQIVPRGKNSDGGLEMRQLLTESVCQPSEAAKLHPNRQIRPFHMAGANMRPSGLPLIWVGTVSITLPEPDHSGPEFSGGFP